MLWGRSKPWLASPAPCQRPCDSSEVWRDPRGCAWLSLGVACPALMAVQTEPRCGQDTAGAKGLTVEGLTCPGRTRHVPSTVEAARAGLSTMALGSFLAGGAVAEGCWICAQAVPEWSRHGVEEASVGGTSLGCSGVGAEGMKSCIPGLGDVPRASLCLSSRQGSRQLPGTVAGLGPACCQFWAEEGALHRALLWVCRKTPTESSEETRRCPGTGATPSLGCYMAKILVPGSST